MTRGDGRREKQGKGRRIEHSSAAPRSVKAAQPIVAWLGQARPPDLCEAAKEYRRLAVGLVDDLLTSPHAVVIAGAKRLVNANAKPPLRNLAHRVARSDALCEEVLYCDELVRL